jgi:predicted permease
MGTWIRRLAYLLTHARRDAELREEIEAHRSMRQSALEQRGLTASDAASASRRAMGNVVLAREEAHDVWRWPRFDDLVRDARSAIRGLRSARAYTLGSFASLSLAFATVAIGIAILNAYLFRPLPYPAADRLSRVSYAAPGRPEPQQMRLDWSALADVVERPLPTGVDLFYLTEGQYTTAVSGLRVAPDALPLLGARAARGRLLVASDIGAQVAVITDSLWRTRFGADPNIVGRTFRAYSANAATSTETIQIIGVLTPDFWLMREGTEIVVPLDPRARAYLVRLKEGVPPQQAARRITEAIRATTVGLPPDWAGVRIERLQEAYVASVRPILNAMAVVVGLGVVLVCINVAMLTVLRIVRRQKEVAVRLALGARRSHVIRMIGTEAVVLCMAAGMTGLVVAHYALPLLANPLQQQLGVAIPGGASALTIDARTILAVSAIGVVAAVVLCVVSIALVRWHTLSQSLGPGPSTDSAPRWPGMRATLLSLEIAGALALLVGSGLMIRTISNLVEIDLGFETTDVVRAHVALPAQRYQDPAALAAFYDELTRQMNGRARAMAITNFTSFYEPQKHPVEVEVRAADARAGLIAISADYFSVLGMRVADGRPFGAADRFGTEPVAIVSESLAARLWPGQVAVGQRIRTAEQLMAGAPLGAWRTVVGIVSDVKQTH